MMRVLRGNSAAKKELTDHIDERISVMRLKLSAKKLDERTSDELRGAISELQILREIVINGDQE